MYCTRGRNERYFFEITPLAVSQYVEMSSDDLLEGNSPLYLAREGRSSTSARAIDKPHRISSSARKKQSPVFSGLRATSAERAVHFSLRETSSRFLFKKWLLKHATRTTNGRAVFPRRRPHAQFAAKITQIASETDNFAFKMAGGCIGRRGATCCFLKNIERSRPDADTSTDSMARRVHLHDCQCTIHRSQMVALER